MKKTSDKCSTLSDWCQGSSPPKIINLRSRRAIEIGLVPLTSFGLKTYIEISYQVSHVSSLLKSEAFGTSADCYPSAPTLDLMIHDILSLPFKKKLVSISSSTARVAQPGPQSSRQRSLPLSRRLITTPCFLNLLGPQVHGPSTHSRDFLYWQQVNIALRSFNSAYSLVSATAVSSFHRPTQLSTIDISPKANVTARCVFC
jgi:hypothetical protein